ncbi:aspartate--tRNA ligase [Candidatus Peregrinibacteria bacterium CG10_big_fil_rev_8_21_14_0_10_49_16]|nr:MAG: aspartate--tRNA ligase [Candidatus Peregrinibacteria bacterium CG10_big_fil_rev_8_21_14_0_10_49_16]
MLRTHTCGELRPEHETQEVTLCGWVHRRRDHGGLVFIDLRDRYGFTQIVFAPENKNLFAAAEKVRSEWVIKVTGTVRKRLEGAERKDNPTGGIEVLVQGMDILNESKTPPFEIDQEKDIGEEVRLEYRYLDLRRARLQKNIAIRHRIVRIIREYFHSKDFLEVETPILIKGTPEGSREYLVPSRLYNGNFYVLPQSPQQLKQLLMIGGVDRYFQVPRCFRDEDQRGDRQPEFTQFEIEMSFVEQEDVIQVMEGCFIELTKQVRPDKTMPDLPFPRMTYADAMHTYGSDKPDLRFALKFTDVSDIAKTCGFNVFSEAETVKAMRIPNGTRLSRKDIDDLTDLAQRHGAKGLAWLRVGEDSGPVAKNAGTVFLEALTQATAAKQDDLLFFAAGKYPHALEPLGHVRNAVAAKLGMVDASTWKYVWIVDFPMFEKNTEGEVGAVHHPFTRPHREDEDVFHSDPLSARATAYDLVLNGVEIGGGSMRIHERDLQKKVFDVLNITDEDAERRFGHMLKAFEYGAPPHGGIAMGLDRVCMLFAEEPNIREVIAFPKDQKAKDLMLGAPSPADSTLLKELGIQVVQ